MHVMILTVLSVIATLIIKHFAQYKYSMFISLFGVLLPNVN